MDINECILNFGEAVTHTKLQANAQGKISILFDELWWVQIYEHLGRIYFDIPTETSQKVLDRQHFRYSEAGLRIIKRGDQQYLQGSIAATDSENISAALYSALSYALSVCEKLPEPNTYDTDTQLQRGLPSGVIRP
jgi:hypothetical protein